MVRGGEAGGADDEELGGRLWLMGARATSYLGWHSDRVGVAD